MKIPEIEIAFTNNCTASCYICSRTHGGAQWPHMSQETFDKVLDQISGIEVDVIQTGGDGDAFLNPIYIESLRRLKKQFPNAKRALYSNFDLLTPKVADMLIEEQLLTHIYTRADTINGGLFYACTGLDFDWVLRNITYFMENNHGIKFEINYSSIPEYKKICKDVLNKEPFQWMMQFDKAMDEYEQVKAFFQNIDPDRSVMVNRIKRSLWAERNDPRIQCEPDMKCGRTYLFDNVCYVWPTGRVGICGYDDGQDALICGNVYESTIPEIWESDERKKVIKKVLTREIKEYPCNNPKACLFW
jgi:hypothetical protein